MSEKQIFYIGKFAESASKQEDGVMTKEAEMFSVGTHRGTEYTEADLKTLVDSFKAEDEIPVQLDHSDSARDTVGYIEKVSLKEGKLLGTLKILDEDTQKRIGLGLMKKLSIGFYLKETEEGLKPSALREVSLVAFPQVKSARLFSENGYVTEYEEGGSKMTENKIDLAEIKKQVKEELDSEMQEQFTELTKQVEALKGVEAKFNESQITSKIEKFSAENKVVPAQGDALKKLMASFSKEQMEAFEEFMGNSQKVDFSEQGQFENQDDEDKNNKDTRSKEQKEFDEFYEQHTAKFGKTL